MHIYSSNILILGDAGYLGSCFATRLQTRGNRVVGIGRHPFMCPWEHRICDVRDSSALRTVVGPDKFDYVFSFLGNVDHRKIEAGGCDVIRDHYLTNLNTIECINSTRLRRFFVMGSADEYGGLASPLSESAREDPYSPYSAAKAGVSHLIKALWHSDRFPGVVGRLFLAYGPNQPANRLLPHIILKCLAGESVDLTFGEQQRDFCFIDDVLDFIELSSSVDEAKGQVLNIGSGVPSKIYDVAKLIQKKIGRGQLNFGAKPYRPGENMSVYADLSRTSQVLGWFPKIDFEKGIDLTIDSFRT